MSDQNINMSNMLAEIQAKLAELKSLESQYKKVIKSKDKKPITYAIHEAASSGKFSIKLERGQVKHYLNTDFIEFIVNNAETLLALSKDCNQLNTDLELAQTSSKKIA